MAETVHKIFENSIHDLAILEQYGIFDSGEIKSILNRRQEFEYRLRKVKKNKDDFLLYIAYEESLFKLIRMRREKSETIVNQAVIENRFILYIRRLFEFTIKKFPSDLSLWLSYINFCQTYKLFNLVTKIYFRLLHFRNDPWIYVQFAKFEFEIRSSAERARKVFEQGVAFNCDAIEIWLEYFRFELLNCAKEKKLMEKNDSLQDDSQNKGENIEPNLNLSDNSAMKIYERFSSKHDNFDVLSKFVKISEKVYCKTAEAIEALILSKLVEKFSHLEELWNLRALNKMAQFKRTLGLSSEEDKILKSKKFCMMQAMKIFESALRKFNSPTMWEYYYRFRFQCLKIDSYKDCTEEIVSLLYSIENSWSSNKITPEIFQLWIKLYYTCFKTNCLAMQRLAKILLDANQRWPNDFEIAFFVGCFLTKLPENQRMTQKFFDDCFRRIHCEIKSTNVDLAINLIELYIDWSIQKKISATKVSKIVTDLNNNIQNYPRKMSEYFKPKLLAIYYHLFGIKKTRLFYEQNKSCPPITKQFFYKMSEIEAHWIEMLEEPETTTATRSNNQNDCNRIKIYDDLIHFFGPDDVQIWLDYIQLVWDDDLSKANNLYQQALKTLNPLQCDQFIRQYSLIKSNRMK